MEPVTFTTEDGIRLEGELRMPDGAARGAAVLCHPHPRHGGSKDHPLLWAIRNDLAGARRLAVLGFNFRGVMGSSGTYGGGRDELRDTRAAIEAARSHCGIQDPRTVVVVPGTDHYFWRREKEAASVIGTFADRALTRP